MSMSFKPAPAWPQRLATFLAPLSFCLSLSIASSGPAFAGAAAPQESPAQQGPVASARPLIVKTPPGAQEGQKKWPLVILLHGYTSSPEQQDAYLRFSKAALERGFIFAAPRGTPTPSRVAAQPEGPPSAWSLFWNATEACCNFEKVPVDDVAYLKNVIKDLKARYPVDPKRVYVFGHSNGGFMAQRLACDAAGSVTAIASLAGSLRPDPKLCKPSRPVGVLNIHGVKDEVVLYAGGQFNEEEPLSRYPGAEATIARWASLNSCRTVKNLSGKKLSLSFLEGSEGPDTALISYQGCAPGGATALLKIPEGSHAPGLEESRPFNAQFIPYVLDFFLSQKRP